MTDYKVLIKTTNQKFKSFELDTGTHMQLGINNTAKCIAQEYIRADRSNLSRENRALLFKQIFRKWSSDTDTFKQSALICLVWYSKQIELVVSKLQEIGRRPGA